MIINIEEYRLKKLTKKMREIGENTARGGSLFADACFTLAYKVKEYESRLKANQRELDKLK